MDSDGKITDLLRWKEQFGSRSPTTNMMLWMRSFDSPCDSFCCFSKDCGVIRCSNCYCNLTAVDAPLARYQCMECKAVPDWETSGEASQRPEFCERCFGDPAVLHWHSKFCLVTETGFHTVTKRGCGTAEASTLREIDLNEYNPADGEECAACLSAFDSEHVPKSPPGCPEGHGVCIPDTVLGFKSVGTYCADAWMQFLASSDRLTHCKVTGPSTTFFPPYCQLCCFESETASWERDFCGAVDQLCRSFEASSSPAPALPFAEALAALEAAGAMPSCCVPSRPAVEARQGGDGAVALAGALAALHEAVVALHPQKWIRAIADSAFASAPVVVSE